MSRTALTVAIHAQLADLPIDEERGALDKAPHCKLLLLRNGPTIIDSLDDDDLQDEDVHYLERCDGGVIVTLLDDGTYSVRYFPDEDEIEDRWSDLCADLDGGEKPAQLCSVEDEDGDQRSGHRDESEDELDDEDEDWYEE